MSPPRSASKALWQIHHSFDALVNCFVLYHVALADGNCFREFLERPQREPLPRDITKSGFAKMLITHDRYQHLVEEHFQQYPVLCIDLKASFLVDIHDAHADRSKAVRGSTYEQMLTAFNEMICGELSQ
jgi:hypothetical protein